MKYFLVIGTAILLSACNQQNDNTQYLQNQIDSLQANTYKPGFGEFMSSSKFITINFGSQVKIKIGN